MEGNCQLYIELMLIDFQVFREGCGMNEFKDQVKVEYSYFKIYFREVMW